MSAALSAEPRFAKFSVEDTTGEQITSRENQLDSIRADGLEEANAERGRCGVGAALPPVAPGGGAALAVAPPAALNAAPSPSNDGVPQPPGAVQVTAGSLVWVAAESAHGKRYGEQIDGVSAELVRHAKTVHSIGDGKTIFCVCIVPDDVEEFNNRPSLCDGRVVSRKQNAFNSLGVELMFRRVQTIEYAHSEKARENEARSPGGKLALEEQYMFGSLVRQAGTLMICPQLLQHVKEEVEKDVQLQKNLRKAKEERELAAKAKGKKKQDENP